MPEVGRRSARQHRLVERTVLLWSMWLLLGLGAVMVYSASSVTAMRDTDHTWSVVLKHLVFMGIGLALLYGASRVPLRVWRDRLTPLVLIVAFGGLLMVAIPGMPLADDVNGASRWLRLGPLGFQPSDLAKLALVLWLARFLVVNRREVGEWSLLKRAAVVVAPMCLLVLAGDDLGTTMLLGVIFVTMWFLAGAPIKQVGAVGVAMAGAAMVAMTALEGFRLRRVLAFLSPEDHVQGAAWQTQQSQIGFASGGLWGQGPGASKAKWGFLPEAHTDFILAVIGEELGLIGTVAIIGALVAVVASGITIGVRCRDPFGRLVAFGISTWLGVQALVNVGVAVGALPTKGIPLPFVSSGGTAMVVALTGVGVLLAISSDTPVGGRRGVARRTPVNRRG